MVQSFKNKIQNRLIDYGLNGVSSARGKRVIMYHGVDLVENKRFNNRFFGKDSFEEQVKYFKSHFNVIPLKDFFEKPSSKDKFDIAITFDDGYKNNYKYALPILEKHQVPATFFITGMHNNEINILWSDLYDIGRKLTDRDIVFNGIPFSQTNKGGHYYSPDNQTFPNYFKQDKRSMNEKSTELLDCFISLCGDFRKDKKYDDYWQLMTDEEIRETAKSSYVTVGSHGYYHTNLGLLDHPLAVKELEMSKAYLENLTNYTIESVGYPDGSYSREVLDAAEKLGYKQQCAVYYHFDEDENDARVIDRIGLYPLPIAETKFRIANNIINS